MKEISIKVEVPEKLKDELKLSLERAAKEFIRKTNLEESKKEFNKIVSKSELSEEDAIELGRKVNKSLHERYKKLYPELK